MMAFARASGFAMAARPKGAWTAVIEAARGLLQGAGIQPPHGDGPRPLGRGKRLRLSYPANGIPGAPRRGGPRTDDEHKRLRHEFAVISVRVFLADPAAQGRTSYHAYIAWRRPADGWATARTFTWSAVKPEAMAANRRDRQTRGVEVPPEVLARGEELKRLLAQRRPGDEKTMPFAEAVAAVLNGPLGELEAPKQP